MAYAATSSSITNRMIRAARLEVPLYEEVEADITATNQALLVVAIVAVANGVGQAIGASIAGNSSEIVGRLIGGILNGLIGWAVHPGDIAAAAKRLRENQIAFQGPDDGSRKRPDGRVLHWKTLNLADDRHGLLPFFIEWSADSLHPSADAPAGCRLEYFKVMNPDRDELSQAFQRIGIDVPVERSDRARLVGLISGPKGDLGVST